MSRGLPSPGVNPLPPRPIATTDRWPLGSRDAGNLDLVHADEMDMVIGVVPVLAGEGVVQEC
jgi:hypothetical protein